MAASVTCLLMLGVLTCSRTELSLALTPMEAANVLRPNQTVVIVAQPMTFGGGWYEPPRAVLSEPAPITVIVTTPERAQRQPFGHGYGPRDHGRGASVQAVSVQQTITVPQPATTQPARAYSAGLPDRRRW